MTRLFQSPALPLVLLISLSLTGCSAEAKKARAVKRADTYAASGEFEKAKIEYLNALKEDSKDPVVFEKLGEIWLKQGAALEAFRFFNSAAKLKPTDYALRARAAELLLGLGQFAEVRKEAVAILEADPTNAGALKLLADSSQTPEDLADAQKRVDAFPDRDNVSYHLARSALALRARDLPGAETAIKAALAADPKSSAAHAAQAALHLFQGNKDAAIAEIKQAAELSPARSTERVSYATIKAQTGDLPEAKRVLAEILKEAPDYVPALRVQAQIAFTEKKYEEALKVIDKALATHPDNFETRLLQAEIWLATGETKKAVESLERVAQAYPAPIAQYQLARAYVQDKNPERATAVLTQSITANHDFTEAILLLAQLDLQAGNAEAVVTAMENLLQKRPNIPQAQLLLVDGYRALKRYDDAAAIIRKQIEAAPNNAQPHLLLGIIQRQQNKPAEARLSLEKALELAPDNVAILNQLVDLDLAEKNFAAATDRLKPQLEKAPKNPALHFLQAKTLTAQQQWEEAEAALQKALELEPNFSPAYDLLISIYVNNKKLPQALEQLGTVLEKNPKNAGALMLTALIHEQLEEYPKAKDAYERLLAVNPAAAVAHNNLAYLYSERLNDLEKAFQHASEARKLQPEDPSIADTLGWIHYKRGEYAQAQTLLRESAGKLPDNMEVQYHLGMAAYRMGQVDVAKAALEKAAQAPGEAAWKAEAQKQLALVASGGADLPLAELEALVKQQPEDPLGHIRLGDAQQKAGRTEKAVASYQAAIKLNPRLPKPHAELAELYAGPLKAPEKAFESAKKARDLAPGDPRIGALIGSIALQAGNVPFAYNALLASSRQIQEDPKVLRDLGWAAYQMGRITEAEEAMQKVTKLAPASLEGAEAKAFLSLLALGEDGEKAAAGSAEIEEALKSNPQHTPALMAHAAEQKQSGKPADAIKTYEAVLKQLPDFALAQKNLAGLLADDPKNTDRALELATKARRNLQDDAQLARTLGQLRYQKKEYAAAIQMLQESAKKQSLDPEGLYYLGMAQVGAGKDAEGKASLDAAVKEGLPEPRLSEATAALEKLEK